MLISSRISSALAAACAASLLLSAAASGAGPATVVTVRVEGQAATLVGPTQLMTNAEHVVKDGEPAHFCPGTSGLGALQLATGGNWSGRWFGGEVKEGSFKGLGYSIETIAGESHAFGSGAFWDLWVNHAESTKGACEVEPEAGSELLWFPCSETAAECANPLAVEVAASANVGQPVPVVVKRFKPSGEGVPAAGVAIAGPGIAAVTDASGHASVVFTHAGTASLQASAPESVRAEATVCVHSGNDGSCGTTAPAGPAPAPTAAAPPASAPYRGAFALVARLIGIPDGATFSRGHAPRLLAGTVLGHTAVTAVSLELRRSYRGRCSSFDAARARFVRARCGHGSFFAAGSAASFSYLLPAALPPGRYVLDVQARDLAGNVTAPARGSSRVVFRVR